MAESFNAYWSLTLGEGLSARHRRGGSYHPYVPDLLVGRSIAIPAALAIRAAGIERAIRGLGASPGARDLECIARFLLRSEAIASSMIEGIAPSPQQVALAELSAYEEIRGFSDQARLVANNITVLRQASNELVEKDELSQDDLVALHAALLPDDPHRGIRTVQNWIGGSSWNPLDAEFVPPPPERVDTLLGDLVAYLNGSSHGPLIQAALVHAQFETIHPFVDGNGRVGRALIHTVLTRGGLTPRAVLPISLVLATLSERYVAGLTAYRYLGDASSQSAQEGLAAWLETFFDAASIAVEQAVRLAGEIEAMRADWAERLGADRAARGIRQEPRADSATARILAILPEAPVMTTRTAQRILKISFPAARDALEDLANASLLARKSVDRGTTGYLAHDVLGLVGVAERRLASTQFDTRISPPSRSVAAKPDRKSPASRP